MTPNRLAPTLWCAALMSTAACHEPFSNDDIVFLKSLPRDLAIDLPRGEDAKALLAAQEAEEGTPAKFYQDARRTAETINKGVFSVLGVVDEVTERPPTVREEDRRVWGPERPGGGPIEYRLSVGRTFTSSVVRWTSTSTPAEVDVVFDYSMELREAGTEPWLPPLFAGRWAPTVSQDEGLGQLFFNLELAASVDPNTEGRGVFFVAYDTRFDQITIELVADAEVDWMNLFAEPERAYRYRSDREGNGAFVFAIRDDHVEGPEVEILVIRARWLASGRGAANVFVFGGDLGGESGGAIECWDDRFLRTFLYYRWLGQEGHEGRPEDCAPELIENLPAL